MMRSTAVAAPAPLTLLVPESAVPRSFCAAAVRGSEPTQVRPAVPSAALQASTGRREAEALSAERFSTVQSQWRRSLSSRPRRAGLQAAPEPRSTAAPREAQRQATDRASAEPVSSAAPSCAPEGRLHGAPGERRERALPGPASRAALPLQLSSAPEQRCRATAGSALLQEQHSPQGHPQRGACPASAAR